MGTLLARDALTRRLPEGLGDVVVDLPRIDRRRTALTVVLVVLVGLLPIMQILALGKLIDELADPGGSRATAILLALAIAGTLLARDTLMPFLVAMAETFGYWINRSMRLRLLRSSFAPVGVQHLEDPRFLDALGVATAIGLSGLTPGAAIAALATVAVGHVTAMGGLTLLLFFRWWIAPLLLVVTFVAYRYLVGDFLRVLSLPMHQTPLLRRAEYFRDLATHPSANVEVRLFGLARWTLDNASRLWTAAMQPVWRSRRPRLAQAVGAVGILAVGGALLLRALAQAATSGEISLGELVIYAQATIAVLPVFVVDLRFISIAQGARAGNSVRNYERLVAASPRRVEGSTPRDEAMRASIVFDEVSFSYPSTSKPVLDHVSLEIRAGSSTALVGANGAGKTTLVKLLARLHEPTSGRILCDGVDIRELDLEWWRHRLAILFQDFVRLPYSVAENVAVGEVDRPTTALREAAATAQVLDLIDDLPAGWTTRLDHGFSGGVDLSGGQWQRLATARTIYAARQRSGVLVLDEPTAHLDPRAEVEFFDRFVAMRDLTRLLISHRLADVRRVDHIYLLEGGHIVEHGSHVDLLAVRGTYARMFEAQRSHYVDA
jgi:ATP-binding cassette subfamily B protein